jgi:hypothetical protein
VNDLPGTSQLQSGELVIQLICAREAGIRWPVALTRAVWERCVSVPPGVVCQDEAGRLWDVLFLLALAARKSKGALVRFGAHVRNDKKVPSGCRSASPITEGHGPEGHWCSTPGEVGRQEDEGAPAWFTSPSSADREPWEYPGGCA